MDAEGNNATSFLDFLYFNFFVGLFVFAATFFTPKECKEVDLITIPQLQKHQAHSSKAAFLDRKWGASFTLHQFLSYIIKLHCSPSFQKTYKRAWVANIFYTPVHVNTKTFGKL